MDLLNEYISLAIEEGETTLKGDYKRGNIIHSKLMKIIEKLKEEELNIRKQFYTLMYHENDSVKIWTAATLLKTFNKEALAVLNDIKHRNRDIFALTAKDIIEIWKKGMLDHLIDWNCLDDKTL